MWDNKQSYLKHSFRIDEYEKDLSKWSKWIFMTKILKEKNLIVYILYIKFNNISGYFELVESTFLLIIIFGVLKISLMSLNFLFTLRVNIIMIYMSLNG